MRTPDAPVRDLLDRAVAAGILTAEQAAAVTALDAPAPGDPAATTVGSTLIDRSTPLGCLP